MNVHEFDLPLVAPSFEAEAAGLRAEDLVQRILDTVPVP